MRYVQVGSIEDGYSVDPRRYLDILPELAPDLPSGARDFVLDREHYDLYSLRCVKDLNILRVKYDARNAMTVTMQLGPNRFKHDAGLVLRYTDVASFHVDRLGDGGQGSLGDVLLDEVLPHERGCAHVIRLTGGTVRVVCGDILARWHLAVETASGLGMNGEHVQ